MITNIEFEGIDYKDSPDFVDAYISYAEKDGVEMTDEELEELNNDSDFVHTELLNYLY